MNYYVIRVAPRQEDKFIHLTKILFQGRSEELIFLRKKIILFKQGKKTEVESPLFPGYVFMQADHLDLDFYWSLKKTGGFLTFIKAQNKIQVLTDKDKSVLSHFLNFGEVAGKSLVTFNQENRIEVLSGPMKGLEGRIVKVDRRKRRARILLDFQDASFFVDLSFEDMTMAPEAKKSEEPPIEKTS